MVNNVTALGSLVIVSLIYCWQIALIGIAVFTVLVGILSVTGSRMQKTLDDVGTLDDSPKVHVVSSLAKLIEGVTASRGDHRECSNDSAAHAGGLLPREVHKEARGSSFTSDQSK